eukprot:m.43789 g.43789  ORF g.43789 m.43789 type:complete len:380 (+) comp8469_c0_seq1:310-1449(+)
MWSEWCLPSDVLDLRRRRQARSLAGKQRVREWRPTALTRLPEPEPISVGDWARSPSFGAIFEWTELHMTASRLAPWRDRGDRAVDDYVTANPLRSDTDPVTILYSPSDTTPPQSPHAELCRKLETPPSWEIDWAAVERGQAVFVAYWPAASLTLWFTSLVGGFSAPLITEVIRCTGYLTGNRAGRRLIETFQMVLSCSLCGSDGLRPEGDGWETILRVRFLHASVRRRLANVADGTKCEHPWDRGVYGVPINQEDLAVTLLAFSLNVIDGIELLRGWPLSTTEQEDFLHLWAVIGWAIGVEDECNPCYRGVAHAQAMLDSIMMVCPRPTFCSSTAQTVGGAHDSRWIDRSTNSSPTTTLEPWRRTSCPAPWWRRWPSGF